MISHPRLRARASARQAVINESDPNAGIRNPALSRFGTERLDKYPRCGRAERQGAESAPDVGRIDDPEPLERDTDHRRNRGPKNHASSVRWDTRPTRSHPANERSDRTRYVETGATSANRQLNAGKMKGTCGALMTDEGGSAIQGCGGGNHAGRSTRQCQRGSKERGRPENRADGQRCGEPTKHA